MATLGSFAGSKLIHQRPDCLISLVASLSSCAALPRPVLFLVDLPSCVFWSPLKLQLGAFRSAAKPQVDLHVAALLKYLPCRRCGRSSGQRGTPRPILCMFRTRTRPSSSQVKSLGCRFPVLTTMLTPDDGPQVQTLAWATRLR